jgi:hypothetical protein
MVCFAFRFVCVMVAAVQGSAPRRGMVARGQARTEEGEMAEASAPRRRVPFWVRLLLVVVTTAVGAAIGGMIAATWSEVMIGLGIALPLAMLAAILPGLAMAVLFVLQAVTCTS